MKKVTDILKKGLKIFIVELLYPMQNDFGTLIYVEKEDISTFKHRGFKLCEDKGTIEYNRLPFMSVLIKDIGE